jgi:hypothetical protein
MDPPAQCLLARPAFAAKQHWDAALADFAQTLSNLAHSRSSSKQNLVRRQGIQAVRSQQTGNSF